MTGRSNSTYVTHNYCFPVVMICSSALVVDVEKEAQEELKNNPQNRKALVLSISRTLPILSFAYQMASKGSDMPTM